MSWAERHHGCLLVVLRADGLEAGWPAPTGARAWQTMAVPLRAPGAAEAPPAALQAAVAAAFAQLRASLLDAGGNGPPRRSEVTVLLSGPAVGVVVLPWSDAWLHADPAQAYARAELQAAGYDVQPADLVAIDPRPALGQPRAVFWVPVWLAREVSALLNAIGARCSSLQALQLVAADWALRQTAAGRAAAGSAGRTGVLGAGVLQLLAGTQPGAMGEVLADAPAAAAGLETRVEGLWQRARVRFPSLALVPGLRVLSLDEPPPDSPVAGAQVSWLPWPEGAGSRAALDRQLLVQARHRPVVEARERGTRRPGPVWSAAALAGLVVAAGLAAMAGQREAAAVAQVAMAQRPAPASRDVPRSAAEGAAVHAVNAAVRQLNLPLPALLRMLEPPRDIPVRLMALELASRSGDVTVDDGGVLKLSAMAAGDRDMTRYVAFLASRRGVAAAHLVRHESDAALPDGPLRFEVELQWQF